jgi:hypothetical protein
MGLGDRCLEVWLSLSSLIMSFIPAEHNGYLQVSTRSADCALILEPLVTNYPCHSSP